VTLHQLRLFYTVAQWLSFSAAARELSLSQPAVSIQIQTLEKNVGVRLFNRSGNKLRLTQPGEALLRSVETLLQAEDEARRIVDELRMGGRNEVKIAIEASCLPAVASLLRGFRAANPGIRVTLEVDSTERILDAVHREAIDGGFVRNGTPRALGQTVAEDALVLVVSSDSPLANAEIVDSKVLAGESVIFPASSTDERIQIERALKQAHLDIRPTMELPSMETIRLAVAANLGVGFVFAGAIQGDLAADLMRQLKIPGLDIRCPVELVHGPAEHFGPLAKLLYDFVTSEPMLHDVPA
jgi:DNA-binding transcriptional LysR family regulator